MKRKSMLISICVVGFLSVQPAGAGSLDPPTNAFNISGEPIPCMKTLNEVEPRNAITEIPVTIDQPGSYYLVGNLTGVPYSNGITIAASSVQIDLNGFLLMGVSNSLSGIYVAPDDSVPPGEFNAQSQISVRNGCVENWENWGVNASNAAHSAFSMIGVFDNDQGGLLAGEACTLSDCAAGSNVGPGIETLRSAIIRDCKVMDNEGVGISAAEGSRITSCTAVNNASHGIYAGGGTTISDCKAINNQASGIDAAEGGSRVHGCTSVGNGDSGLDLSYYCIARDCLLMNNTNNGIVANSSCYIVENLAGNNGKLTAWGAGIRIVGPGNRIADNDITANNIGIVLYGNTAVGNWIADNTIVDSEKYGVLATNDAVGNLIIRNAAGSYLAGPDYVLTGNQWGDIRPFIPGAFTTNNPWANLTLKP